MGAEDSSSVIDLILRFIVDKQSQQDAQQAVSDVEAGATGQGAGQGGFGGFSPDQIQVMQSVLELAQRSDVSIQDAAAAWSLINKYTAEQEKQLLGNLAILQQTAQATTQVAVQSQEAAESGKKLAVDNAFKYLAESAPAAVQGEKDVATGAAQLNKELGETNDKTEKTKSALGGFAGFTLLRVSREFEQLGKAILSPIDQFVKAEGFATQASGQYSIAQAEIANSTERIGQTMTEAILPAIQTAARLSSQVADFFEKYPGVADAAVGLGGAAVIIGALFQVLGTVVTTLRAVEILGKVGLFGSGGSAAGAATAAEAAGTGAAAGSSSVAAIVASVVPVAFAIAVPIASALFAADVASGGKSNVLGDAIFLAQELTAVSDTLAKTMFGAIPGFDGLYKSVVQWQSELYDWAYQITGNTAATKAATEAEQAKQLITQSEVEAYIQYQKQKADAEQKYEDQRTKIVDDAGAAQVAAEQAYQKNRQDTIDAYSLSVTQKSQDFYIKQTEQEEKFRQSQADATRKFQLAETQNKQQHNENLKQIEQDHKDKVFQLTNDRDALGLVNENNAYAKKVSAEDQKYSDEQAKLRQNYKEQQAIAERNYEEQRQTEQAAFELAQSRASQAEQKKLATLDENYKKEQAKNATNEQDKLNQLQTNYNKELIQRNQAFADQLINLGLNLHGEQQLKVQYYALMNADLRNFLNQQRGIIGTQNTTGESSGTKTTTGNQPRAHGGYASYGTYTLGDSPSGSAGDDEYVLNGKTTKMLEQALGGKISDSDLMKMVAGNQSSKKEITMTINAKDGSIRQTKELIGQSQEEIMGVLHEFIKAS